MRKNKVKPTAKQRKTFENIPGSKSLGEAMVKGGYAPKTSTHPSSKLVESEGFRLLIEEYREKLLETGVNIDLMAEIQRSGLGDKDAKVRLDYLKEAKKDFGLWQADNKPSNVIIGIGLNKKDYEE
jgi:hypothetical protein